MVPITLIILLFLAAFVLCTWQYYRIDPMRRLLNLRFALMFGAVVCCIGYPIYDNQYPGDRLTSWIFFGLALIWLVVSCYLLRRVPPKDSD